MGTDRFVGDDTYRIQAGETPILDGIAAADLYAYAFGADLSLEFGGEGVYLFNGLNGAIENFQFADGQTLDWRRLIGSSLQSPITRLTAEAGAQLAGGAGNDVLEATGGGATFSGGRGGDTLIGDGGNNVYLYHLGDGSDFILDSGGQSDVNGDPAPNILRFGAGIAASDLALGLAYGTLALRVGDIPGDTLHLETFDPGNALAERTIDRFEFADGSSLSYEQLLAKGFDIQGTAGADTLAGTHLDDRITGGAGADTLDGGDGLDTAAYAASAQGVNVSLTNGLGHGGDAEGDVLIHMENLSGSAFADQLSGDGGANSLTGNAGNDTLDGGAGNDRLQGGQGFDTYVFDRGDGLDTWIENDTTAGNVDIARFGSTINFDQLWLKRSGNNLEAQVIGTTDKAVIQNWYSGSANHIERFEAGGKALLDSQVDALVQAMAAFAPPAAGQSTLPDTYRQALAPVLAANWQ